MKKRCIENFLEYKYWENAVDLVKHELILKNKNSHFFTFNSLFYKYNERIKSKKYFLEIINKNSFYFCP